MEDPFANLEPIRFGEPSNPFDATASTSRDDPSFQPSSTPLLQQARRVGEPSPRYPSWDSIVAQLDINPSGSDTISGPATANRPARALNTSPPREVDPAEHLHHCQPLAEVEAVISSPVSPKEHSHYQQHQIERNIVLMILFLQLLIRLPIQRRYSNRCRIPSRVQWTRGVLFKFRAVLVTAAAAVTAVLKADKVMIQIILLC
jgi:hypothetical protein